MLIADVIAPQHMQTDEATREAQERLYSWLAEELGPHALVKLHPMDTPFGAPGGEGFFLPPGTDPLPYAERYALSLERARAAGLEYVHSHYADIHCHSCDGLLLRTKRPDPECFPCEAPSSFCDRWGHLQFCTDGHCDWCGAAVPIVTLSRADLDEIQLMIAGLKATDPLVIAKNGHARLPVVQAPGVPAHA